LLYILTGQDDYSLTQYLGEIKEGIGDQSILTASTTQLDGQKVTLDLLKTTCETVPFLTERRLVIIKGLLERFEPRGRPGRNKKTTSTNQRDDHQALGDCIKNMPDSTVLVLVEGNLTNGNPLLRELTPQAVVKSFPLLRDAQLRQWTQRRVVEEGGSISAQAVDLLAKLVGSNLWIMASEINKLVLFTSGRRIGTDDVRAVGSYTQQASVFAMVDAIVEFKVEAAEQLLQRLLQSGAAPVYLLVMLARQIQMIARARELSSQGKPKVEIQRKLGLPSEYALRKTLEQANRYSLPRIKQVYHRLLEADLSIKRGKYDAELALNILVAELCHRGRTQVRPG